MIYNIAIALIPLGSIIYYITVSIRFVVERGVLIRSGLLIGIGVVLFFFLSPFSLALVIWGDVILIRQQVMGLYPR